MTNIDYFILGAAAGSVLTGILTVTFAIIFSYLDKGNIKNESRSS